MKRLFPFFICVFSILLLSCGDDNETVDSINTSGTGTGTGSQSTNPYYDHKVAIAYPNNNSKNLDANLPIEVEFSSGTNRTVHYIQIRIYNKLNNTEVYKKPSDTHLDDDSGSYTFKDNLTLSTANGFSSNSQWIFEAKVWGPGSNNEEVIKTLEFNVN